MCMIASWIVVLLLSVATLRAAPPPLMSSTAPVGTPNASPGTYLSYGSVTPVPVTGASPIAQQPIASAYPVQQTAPNAMYASVPPVQASSYAPQVMNTASSIPVASPQPPLNTAAYVPSSVPQVPVGTPMPLAVATQPISPPQSTPIHPYHHAGTGDAFIDALKSAAHTVGTEVVAPVAAKLASQALEASANGGSSGVGGQGAMPMAPNPTAPYGNAAPVTAKDAGAMLKQQAALAVFNRATAHLNAGSAG